MYKNSRLYSVISYITWIGLIVAFILHDKNDTLVRRHINQALILNLAETVSRVLYRIGGLFGVVAWVIDVVVFVLFIMGIIRAFKMSEEPLPIIGGWDLIGNPKN